MTDIKSDGRSGFAYVDEWLYHDNFYTWDNLYYPGLYYLNMAMYENIYGSMRMCKKLRDFLKPAAPVNDLRNSACYPMGIPERKLPWSDNVMEWIDDTTFRYSAPSEKKDIINSIIRKQNEYKYNINRQYGKYGR